MAAYITIDGGTSNTRMRFVDNGVILGTLKFDIGARVGIENNDRLKETIKGGISSLTEKYGKAERIIASGMITSEGGLCEIQHIAAPAGIAELHENMREITISELSDIPFVFIPGVKMSGSLKNTDMMRGEETELFGIINGEETGVYVLPGSHSKIIEVVDGKIKSFTTMLTGEMIFALSQSTILKNAVSLDNDMLDESFLFDGYDYCKQNGINEALFKVRVLKNLFAANEREVYSFFIGAVLSGEIGKLIEMNPKKVTVCGKKQIKKAEAMLIQRLVGSVEAVTDELSDSAASFGAVRIYEYKGCRRG